MRAFLVAIALVIALAGTGEATVTITGTFTGGDSFACYPATIEVSPQPANTALLIFGEGVVFYNEGDVNCVQPVDDVLGVFLAAGQPTTVKLNVGRDRLEDTRVNALFLAAVENTQDQATQDVRFTDLLPSIRLQPPFIFPATKLERNECYLFTVDAYPETERVVLNVTSSVTKGVPDLALFGDRNCQTPVAPLDLQPFRGPRDHAILGVRRAAGNAGNTGTISVAADPAFTIANQSYPPKSATLFFEPRTALSLTAPATTNLDPNGCHPATVKVGASDLDVIKVRVYSGTGNARVYSSAGCLTTLTTLTMAPNTSRQIWIRTVAPDVPYASLVADSTRAGNVEVTRPPTVGLQFYFTP